MTPEEKRQARMQRFTQQTSASSEQTPAASSLNINNKRSLPSSQEENNEEGTVTGTDTGAPRGLQDGEQELQQQEEEGLALDDKEVNQEEHEGGEP